MAVTRAMLLAVLLLAGCGGGDDRGARIAVYHLEDQIEQIDPREMTDDAVVCGRTATICPGEPGTPTGERSGVESGYRVDGDPHLDAEDFVTERAQALVADVTGEPAVILDVAPESARSFEVFTRNLVWIGRERGTPQHIAVVVDDELVAWPMLDYMLYPSGLEATNGIQLTVSTLEEAQRLARAIRGEE